MTCKSCDGKGYIKSSVQHSNSTQELVRPCDKCNNSKGYYRYIKEKYGQNTNKSEKIQSSESETKEGVIISLVDRRKRK